MKKILLSALSLSLSLGAVFSASACAFFHPFPVAPGDSARADSAQSRLLPVGYGSQPRKFVTGSVFSVSGCEMNNVAVISSAYGLHSRVPGLLVSATGAMGVNAQSSLRGAGSPLYVIDGVPLNPMGLKDNTDLLQLLPTGDIVSVEVLKDASASAIFGMQGENGVILITTRQGQVSKPTLQFDSYAGLQVHRSPLSDESKTIVPQNYGLGVRGGMDKLQYHVSGYLFNAPSVNEPGFYVPSLTRYSLRANLQAQPVKGLTLGANWMLSRVSRRVEGMDRMNGQIITSNGAQSSNQWLGNVFAQYEFLPGFALRLNYGLNQFDQHADGQVRLGLHGGGQTTIGLYERNWPATFHLAESMLSFRRRLNEQHRIDVIAGLSLQKLTMERAESIGTFINASYSTTRQRPQILSFFSRIHYTFRDRYLLMLTTRHDGYQSEPNQQSYFKPAVSLGWRVSEEAFMENAGAIEELKLRVGYGNNRLSLSDHWNLGLDLGLWHNRVLLTADYYRGIGQPQTHNLSPAPFGIPSLILSTSTASRGVEFSVRTRNTTGKFQWDTQLILAHNLTTISISGLGTGSGNGTVANPITVRVPLRSFWEQETLESWGTNLYITPNIPTPPPPTEVADMNPDWFGGLSNGFRYGRFSGEVLMQLSLGGEVFVTRLGSKAELKSRSFLQMRNITLGYDLPSGGWDWMKQAHLYLSLQNLFAVSELSDKDVAGWGMPRERMALIGLRVGF